MKLSTRAASIFILIACAVMLTIPAFSQQTNQQTGTNAQQGQGTADKEKGEDSVFDEPSGWRVRDFKPYIKAIDELEKLNKEYSENLLKLAKDEYATGLDILEDMENEIIKLRNSFKTQKYLNERFYWQEIDRKNSQQRLIAHKKYEAKMKAVTYFTKSINYLDQIQNMNLREDEKFVNFQARLYQVYVSTQYDLNNFQPCIPILERYLVLAEKDMGKKTKKTEIIWAYKYLASCYGYLEKVLSRYKHATEDEILIYRNKKNRSMLQAVEIKYGVESPHYKHLQEIVEADEKKAEMINDYK